MAKTLDLNCDMGESFGAWRMGDDAGVMPWITSANIACGFHAGDFTTMTHTVQLAVAQNVSIGAHVSLPDVQGFGRREMRVSPDEAHAMTLYQIGALQAIARAHGASVAHVKPHGALYNMAAKDAALAAAIARAVRDADDDLVLVGLANSALTRAGVELGIRVAHEAFADRRYERDGSLTPRKQPDAVIHDVDAAVAQALAIAEQSSVQTRDSATLTVRADTICVHGDRADAAVFAQRLRQALDTAGIAVRACA